MGSLAVLLVLWSAGATVAPASQPMAKAPPCGRLADFVPASFPATPKVDNGLFPLTPGLQITTEGTSAATGQTLPHRVVFTVTDLTKMINGVRAYVLWDVDLDQGQVAEAELAFFAQDSAGNVWNLGEYPEQYKNGQFKGAPDTWIAGIDGAEAGIQMPGAPHLGEPYYIQGLAPGIGFLDCAQTFQENASVCVPFGCFDKVLVTDEISPLDAGNAHQRKYYAPGVGMVEVGAVNDPEAETMALVNRTQLDPDALAAVRKAALDAEARGAKSSKVYGQTSPSEVLPPPPPAPAPQPTATAARAAASLAPTSARLTRSGRMTLAVRCLTGAPGACRGVVDLYLRGTRTRVGTARFIVGAGKSLILRPVLSAHAHSLLRARRRLPVIARTRNARAGAQPFVATASVTLRLR